ncbi:hypothetical protein MPTK1_5g21780 [Marchantia polymorpha subsp. ruderalis]|uniref:Uncharacterized protein n=2 Tax=Marchantia polymorpha TaxID=3197 RepID=A0AAF6BKW5_MARPO|nr:hypothetical protein MARPO_0106s0021 [Marchantia polymorpha]BBN12649.1 hypothetical protein Mp_5g21780 [Marchantia polymorpha subsp. ruderalis]|eukprot:PTQ31821.1 hypothetical protein MARPO_0106s0021 [Marchantia polymorpha]
MHIPSLDGAGGEPPAALVLGAEPPTSFVCRSGVLLWGQLNTVIQGANSLKLDTSEKPAEIGCTGNIVQHAFRFKAAAKKGRWRVESAYMGDRRIGFVCFHEDVDGVDILRRATNVGISKHNDHEDSEIVYVNEYDWSLHHGPNVELILQTLGIDENDKFARMVDGKDYYSNLVATRFMLLDEQGFQPLIRALKNGVKLHPRNYLLAETPAAGTLGDVDSNTFGVHLSLGEDEDGWERGWMAFSGGVLVGFVYDGDNTCLDLESTTQLSLGNTIVEGELRRIEDDEDDDEEEGAEAMEEEDDDGCEGADSDDDSD